MDSASLPLPFYLCVAAVVVLLVRSWKVRGEAWGIPMMVVTLTAGSWYLVDPLYNDYNQYLREVGPENLSYGFWEVLIFFITLGALSPLMNKKINGKLPWKQSQILQMMKEKEIETPQFQDQIHYIACGKEACWRLRK